MTDPSPEITPAPDKAPQGRSALRDQLADAIRNAAHVCPYGCDCNGAPIFATLGDDGGRALHVEGRPEILADMVLPVVEAAIAKAEQRYKGIAEGYAIEVRDLVTKLGVVERERDVAVAAADPFKIERVTSLVAASTRLVRTERDAERQNAERAESAVERVQALADKARSNPAARFAVDKTGAPFTPSVSVDDILAALTPPEEP